MDYKEKRRLVVKDLLEVSSAEVSDEELLYTLVDLYWRNISPDPPQDDRLKQIMEEVIALVEKVTVQSKRK